MNSTRREQRDVAMPRVSAAMMEFFAAYGRRHVFKHFHALRVSKDGLAPCGVARPLVIFLNHAAWWDPLVCMLLSREFFSGRTSFAPIDAAMLERYRFFRQLGFFGIEQNSRDGAVKFLRISRAILASSQNALWLTPQGCFTDVRTRPLRLREGLGALAVRQPEAAFVPLAIEYPFWTESQPEILVSIGEPIIPRNEATRTAADWTRAFADALEYEQDELAARSCRRDPKEWLTSIRGASGVSKTYDAWRWLRAWLYGEKFVREHHPEAAQ